MRFQLGWGRVPHAGVPEIVTRPHPSRNRGGIAPPKRSDLIDHQGERGDAVGDDV